MSNNVNMYILAGPPTCVGELRRWAHGDYTLLHDSVKREYALDLQLHVGCAGVFPASTMKSRISIHLKLMSVFCMNHLVFQQIKIIQTKSGEKKMHICEILLLFSGWKTEFGGFTSYIAHDEDEEVSDDATRCLCFNVMILLYYYTCTHRRLAHIVNTIWVFFCVL